MKKFKIFLITILYLINYNIAYSAEQIKPMSVDWSFKGLTGKFDRASLQRGFQVYKEVCSSCHSMQYLSYRNLGEPGGPEFTEAEVKAIAASYEITDGPNNDGEMFTDLEDCLTNLLILIRITKLLWLQTEVHIPRYVCLSKSKKRWSQLYLFSSYGYEENLRVSN